MERQEIIELLTELGRRLDSEGITGEMYLVSGAAIALAFDQRRATRDIDAVFEPKAVVYRHAAAMAEGLGLPAGVAESRRQGVPGRARPRGRFGAARCRAYAAR